MKNAEVKLTFTQWLDKVKDVAVKEYGFKKSVEFDSTEGENGSWWHYYNDGLSPVDAMKEDSKHY